MRMAFVVFITCLAIWFFASPASDAAPVYYFDLSGAAHVDYDDPAEVRVFWDTLHLVASVQGIVNRECETLFVRTQPQTDDFWWNYLRETGQWLSGREVVVLASITELLETFATSLKGSVVYGEKPWSLSNVASTIAGVEQRMCLRFDLSPNSIYQQVLQQALQSHFSFAHTENTLFLCDAKTGDSLFAGKFGEPLPIISALDKTLPPLLSTGSAKCDAYRWALRNYIEIGRVSPVDMAYYLDSYWLTMPAGSPNPWNCTLMNHDFCIARGGFFFELHCWGDETPVDDPKQPVGTDLETVKAILKAMYRHSGGKIVDVHGFTPWAWKYTSHGKAGSRHEPVPTEWESVRIFSAYNAAIDADALGLSSLANGSFYQHFPLQDFYMQPPRPTLDSLRERGWIDASGRVTPTTYIAFYMGDYDSAAWLTTTVPALWRDAARGSIPCNWAFNPNLDKRAPQVLHYVRTNATPNDWFITGDSGAGYLNPGMLAAPRLDPEVADGWHTWTTYNSAYYQKYDLDITGFVIDGYAPAMGERGLKAYATFSPHGLVQHHSQPPNVWFDMPTIAMRHDLDGKPTQAGKELADAFVATRQDGKPLFLPIRTILKTPTWHKETMDITSRLCGKENVRFVDMYTFFLLLKAEAKASRE